MNKIILSSLIFIYACPGTGTGSVVEREENTPVEQTDTGVGNDTYFTCVGKTQICVQRPVNTGVGNNTYVDGGINNDDPTTDPVDSSVADAIDGSVLDSGLSDASDSGPGNDTDVDSGAVVDSGSSNDSGSDSGAVVDSGLNNDSDTDSGFCDRHKNDTGTGHNGSNPGVGHECRDI